MLKLGNLKKLFKQIMSISEKKVDKFPWLKVGPKVVAKLNYDRKSLSKNL